MTRLFGLLRIVRWATLALLVAGSCLVVRAADPIPSATPEAMRLLKSNCFSCHNDQKKKGGLVMTSRETFLKGGDNGPALDPAGPEKSPFLDALAADADPHTCRRKSSSPRRRSKPSVIG